MRQGRARFAAAILGCSLGFLLLVAHGINSAHHWLLVEEAKSTGMDWAHHIEARLPDLLGMTDGPGDVDFGQVPDPEEFGHLVSDILAIGNIYQVDFINSNCLCEVSIGSYERAPDHDQDVQSGRDAHGHEHDHDGDHSFDNQLQSSGANSGKVSLSRLKHVLFSEDPHPSSHHTHESGQLAVDRALARQIIASGEHEIAIRHGGYEHQPRTFAEVYHPVYSGGEPLYILRVLVDLEAKSQIYGYILYGIAVSVLLLSLAAVGVPLVKYMNALNAQREASARTQFLANNDLLTGIANRNAFQEKAPGVLDACLKEGRTSVLVLVDVNNFKEINDFHGHHAGDRVLQEVAGTLLERAYPGSLVSRLGGDEFALLMCETRFDGEGEGQPFTLPDAIDLPIDNAHQSISVTLCAGLARFPRDGNDLPELMQNADLALYAAKGGARPQVREFDRGMGQAFKDRIKLFEDFRDALRASEIVPHYQPLIDIETGRIEGFEALARWQHAERGILTPAVFHDALDNHEISEIVGEVMLAKVLADMARWRADGVAFESVALNVGEADLLRPGFVLDVVSGLAAHDFPRGSLAIEVTERCVFGSNKDVLLQRLEELRAAGCGIALDDFGTGYSSITHIKELPCTAVKIDKSFIKEVVHDQSDQAIVKALVDMGRSIGFQLVAEGVETVEQRDLVQRLGCHLAQGYFYARPIPAADVPGTIAHLTGSQTANEAV